jgi:hypothetical protein
MADQVTLSVALAILNAGAGSDIGMSDFADFVDATVTEFGRMRIDAQVAGSTWTCSDLDSATLSCVIIKNYDSTNFVSATWDDAVPNSNTQKIPAKGFLVIPDLLSTTDVTLTADTGDCICEVFYCGT